MSVSVSLLVPASVLLLLSASFLLLLPASFLLLPAGIIAAAAGIIGAAAGTISAFNIVEFDKEGDGVEEVVDECSVLGFSDDFIVDDDGP